MMEQSRSPLRFLAPAALLVFAAVVYLVVAGSGLTPLGSGGAGGTAKSSGTEQEAVDSRSSTAEERRARRRGRAEQREGGRAGSYKVKPGDTIDGIARDTGVAAERIEELNPDLDPQALAPGQSIKLRE